MASRARGLAWALLLAAGAGSAPVWAQRIDVPVSDAARCLTVRAGAPEAPEYPFEASKSGVHGAVQVLLEFDRAESPPKITVQENIGGSDFVKAVRQHARELRVPCLKPGAGPARLVRDYVFRPDHRQVHWFRAVDAGLATQREHLRCVSNRKGKDKPAYPMAAVRDGLQTRVVAQLQFHAADQPPVATVYARPNAVALQRAVEAWVVDLRMPCHPGGDVSGNWLFEFILEGTRAFGFRDVPFRTLVLATAGIEQQRLDIDTREMGCPFDVEFQYLRPAARNRVGEIGDADPRRRTLLEWMETIELKLPAENLDTVYGDTTRITVPCIRIDLKPKE